MFDIGWPEMLVVAIVLIVIVGPKDLPGMLRNFGRTTTKLRSMAGDFRKQFDDALKEAELGDVKGLMDDVRKLNPTADLKKALNPMQKAAEDVRSGLDAAMKPTAKKQDEKDAAQGSVSTATSATPAPPLKNGHDDSAVAGVASKVTTSAGAAKKASAAKPKAAKAAAPKAKSVAAKPAAAKTAPAAPKAAAKSAPAKTTKASASAKKSGQTR